MSRHPASTFRDYRSKYFAIAHKHGFDKAFYVLQKEQKKINDPRSFVGLLCELIFLKENYTKLQLTPTLDCGDHCDFLGSYNNCTARFDVTSSLEYKDLEDYSPFQKQGRPYYIVLVDPESQKVDRIIDINFPFCPICGGRLLNILIEENDFTRQGTPSPSQKVLTICSNDYEHVKMINDYNYHLPDINEEINSIQTGYEENTDLINSEVQNIISMYGTDNSLFFSKLSDHKIHACGSNGYTVIDRDGDGYYETKFYWQADIIDKLLPSSLGVVADSWL